MDVHMCLIVCEWACVYMLACMCVRVGCCVGVCAHVGLRACTYV